MRRLRWVPAIALLIPLAACSGGDGSSEDGSGGGAGASDGASDGGGPSSGRSSGSSGDFPEPGPSSSAATQDGLTAPGSVLLLGETATVPLESYNEDPVGTIDVTLTSIEATDATLPDGGGDGDVVYRIDGTFTLSEPPTDDVQPTVNVSGGVFHWAYGKATEADSELGCEPVDLAEQDDPGTIDFCVTAVGPADAPVVGSWSLSGSDYSYEEGTEITWRQ